MLHGKINTEVLKIYINHTGDPIIYYLAPCIDCPIFTVLREKKDIAVHGTRELGRRCHPVRLLVRAQVPSKMRV